MTPPSSSRFGTFFSRVEVEREVLTIINSIGNGPKLHGLTAVTIDRWAEVAAATVSPKAELVREVVRLLHRIAIRAGAHADQSRVVFANEASVALPVQDLVNSLRTLCLTGCITPSPNCDE